MLREGAGPLSEAAMREARERLDSRAKPLGSLGHMEEYAVRLAGIRRRAGGQLRNRWVLIFAADNGIHAEGISPVPQEVTAAMASLIAEGGSGVSVLARATGANVAVYDVGVAHPIPGWKVKGEGLMRGTDNMCKGPAIPSREIVEQAIERGRQAVADHADADVFGVGEMGICNTSTAAAVSSLITGLDPERTTGLGIGLNVEQYGRKLKAVTQALRVNHPDPTDTMEVMRRVGGLDIAAMTGAYLEAARRRVPVVIDGYISATAALCAWRLDPASRDYMFASHMSAEPGFAHVMDMLGQHAPLRLNMRLGEGSGCPLMFELLDASLAISDSMAALEDAQVDPDALVDIRTRKH